MIHSAGWRKAAGFCFCAGIACIGAGLLADVWMKETLRPPRVFYLFVKAPDGAAEPEIRKVVLPNGHPPLDLETGMFKDAEQHALSSEDAEWASAVRQALNASLLQTRPIPDEDQKRIREIFSTSDPDLGIDSLVGIPHPDDMRFRARIAAIPSIVKALASIFFSWSGRIAVLFFVAALIFGFIAADIFY